MNLKEYLHSIASNSKQTHKTTEENVTSVEMSFENSLIESSKRNSSFSTDWVEAEVKKSGDYFKKEIYTKE